MYELTDRSIRVLQAGTAEGNAEHIRSALSRGLPELSSTALCSHDGSIVIVGSGPSLPDFLEQIREEKRLGKAICAIKGAHDWLIDNGVEPDLFVTCEPRDRPLKHVSKHCTYLVASRCPPTLFDQLVGQNARVVIWHSFASKPDAPSLDGVTKAKWEDFDPEDECEAFKGKFCIGGGSTSGLRAIYIGYVLGFRKAVLYGMDSCLGKDKFTKRFTGENIGNGTIVDVIVGGKRFWCNGAMAKQANEFQPIVNHMHDMTIEVKGDGLLAEIMKQRKVREFK